MNIENKIVPKLRFPEFVNEGEWKIKKLKQVSEINPTSNKLPDSFVYIDLESVDSGSLLQKKIISLSEAPSRAQRLLKDGDIIFQMVRPYQKNNYLFLDLKDNFSYVASTGYAQIRACESNTYLYHYLHNELFVKRVIAKCTGSNYPAINSSDLAEISIEIPKSTEQQKIASCLSSLDELIAAHTDKLEALKDHKKGLLQQLFPAEGKTVPKLRFKEFEGDGEWDLIEFSKYIELYRGSSPRPIQNYLTKEVDGVNWIKIGDTKYANNFIINRVDEKITPVGANKSRKVSIGELILANSMSFGKTYELAIDGYIYDGWFVLRNYEDYYEKQFLLQLLNSDYMQNQYKKLSAGGIVQNISSDIVYKTIVPHTKKSEQQKIANFLSSIDNEIAAQAQKIEGLKEHKKGLMQGLFPVINE